MYDTRQSVSYNNDSYTALSETRRHIAQLHGKLYKTSKRNFKKKLYRRFSNFFPKPYIFFGFGYSFFTFSLNGYSVLLLRVTSESPVRSLNNVADVTNVTGPALLGAPHLTILFTELHFIGNIRLRLCLCLRPTADRTFLHKGRTKGCTRLSR